MTGVITSIPPLVEQPPGNNANNPAGLPGVTYTAAIPTLPQTWTGVQTFSSGTIVLSGSGGASQVLRQSSLNGPVTVSQLTFSDISGTIGPIQIPPPTVSTLGGVFSKAATANQFLTQIGTDGSVSAARPSVSDISGAAALTRTSDTNVVLTLGGTPATALLAATSITVSWSGTLAASRGGFGADVSAQSGVPLFAAGVPTFISTTGSGNFARATSPTFVTPALGTPSSGTLTSCTGLPLSGLTAQGAFTFVVNNTSGSASPTAVDIGSFTSKASPAGTDLIVISDQAASGALKRATISSIASAGSVASVNGQTGTLTLPVRPQGRLTLQTATPVMTTTQSAKTTIYYTAYQGNQIPIYDGTNMVSTTITGGEISVLTTDTTKSPAAIGASKVNDWFVWNDSGTLRISHGPDWTNDTTRSAGTALVMVNGILLNNASITNGPAASRGTYVGTTRSNASSQLDWIFGASASGGTAAVLWVWNAYNRVDVTTAVTDSGNWSTGTSATPAALNAGGVGSGLNNRISAVFGLAEDGAYVSIGARLNTAAAASAFGSVGFALDATNVMDKRVLFVSVGAASVNMAASIQHAYAPQLGAHFWQATQAGDGTNSAGVTFGQDGSFSAKLRM